ncbi:phage baseplate plug family protein [Fusobacterium animalis]|uniref:phage baseplate plug family protein n=1 Tax=Fusobacterium animalis TaxID=76859 RepID=UPI0030D36715
MKAIEIDVTDIESRGIIAELPNNINLELIYNTYDSFIYLSILDGLNQRITGFNKLVPNIDFLSLVRNENNLQLRCIKINDFAEEKDFITPKNLNKDYKFFLIGDDDGEVMETS